MSPIVNPLRLGKMKSTQSSGVLATPFGESSILRNTKIIFWFFSSSCSDVWRDHYAVYKQQYGDNEERILRKMERERFVLPKESTFDYIFERRNETNIGETINIALEKIEEANKTKKLEGVFRNIDFNSESSLGQTRNSNKHLKNLVEDFANPILDFRPSRIQSEDVIGSGYEYLIARFASDAGKKGGEFYTPREKSRCFWLSLSSRSRVTAFMILLPALDLFSSVSPAKSKTPIMHFMARKVTAPPGLFPR